MELTPDDQARLSEAGIGVDEVMAQWRTLLDPPRPIRLVRPCTVNDGILRLDGAEADRLAQVGREALSAGHPAKFVPASGAATRMFQDLLAWRGARGSFDLEALVVEERRDPVAASVLRTLRHLRAFAFYPGLRRSLAARGAVPEQLLSASDATPVVTALLDDHGLGLAATPKALLPFHVGPDGPRTAFVEHLHEALAVGTGSDGRARVHFTVSAEHLDRFRAALAAALASFANAPAQIEVSFSVQAASTDTVAVRADGTLARLPDGRLLLRPSGHGALLGNLESCPGDLLLVRNIDNVEPAQRRQVRIYWSRVLAGLARETTASLGAIADDLESGVSGESPSPEAYAIARLRSLLGVDLSSLLSGRDAAAARAHLLERLARPVRVCGMVPNTGEPGGGPFWVAGADGVATPQIVEAAQVARTMDQQAVFAAATHFNPVDMVLDPGGARGRRARFADLVDRDGVIVTRKIVDGQELRVLERPGLWNGSMAGWNTVFVEMPIGNFHPVKTLNDLLRPAHRPMDEAAAGAGARS